MGKGCCEKKGLKKGRWSREEDEKLWAYIQSHGHGNWHSLPKLAGLLRCGKSCRFRWMNYMRPGVKRGDFSEEEERTIIKLHEMLGNRWAAIAARLPGRTDNEVKNFWHTYLLKHKKANMAIEETDHLLTKSSESTANQMNEFQFSTFDQNNPLNKIWDYPNSAVMSSRLPLNNLSTGIGIYSSVYMSTGCNELVVDQFKKSEASSEFSENFSSKSSWENILNGPEDSTSVLSDPGFEFPPSPLSFGEFDGRFNCLGGQYYNEMDYWFDYNNEGGGLDIFSEGKF